jgi:hypothetical protein
MAPMKKLPVDIQILAKLQHLINTNATLFDNQETLEVRPAFELSRGEPDSARPYIQVRARRVDLLKAKLPPNLGGVPLRVVQGTLYEQAIRAIALARSAATPEIAATAWRTGLLDVVTEARDYSTLTYRPVNPTWLVPVDGQMTLVIHVSPEAGWLELGKFLTPLSDWMIAMYDFTAPHIIAKLDGAVRKPGGTISLVLDPKISLPTAKQRREHPDDPKANDRTEVSLVEEYRKQFGSHFHFSWASIGSHAQFASAYHIKVAVRDQKAFWLSSGNWQSSNQPDIDFLKNGNGQSADKDLLRTSAHYNREWHVICENSKLADIYRKYIERDLSNAQGSPGPDGDKSGVDEAVDTLPHISDEDFVMELRSPTDIEAEAEIPRMPRRFFPPLTLPTRSFQVQPILTPDNYADHVLPLVQSAKSRLWFQNQSLSVIETRSDKYSNLLEALKRQSWDIEDCKIIFRDFIRSKTLDYLRSLSEFGFNMSKVHVMKNCHTKGILVDSRRTLVGSHNWTNEGTTYNRDASLLFDDAEVTKYFEQVFEHDWDNLSYDLPVPEVARSFIAYPGESVPEAAIATRYPWDPNNDGSDT